MYVANLTLFIASLTLGILPNLPAAALTIVVQPSSGPNGTSGEIALAEVEPFVEITIEVDDGTRAQALRSDAEGNASAPHQFAGQPGAVFTITAKTGPDTAQTTFTVTGRSKTQAQLYCDDGNGPKYSGCLSLTSTGNLHLDMFGLKPETAFECSIECSLSGGFIDLPECGVTDVTGEMRVMHTGVAERFEDVCVDMRVSIDEASFGDTSCAVGYAATPFALPPEWTQCDAECKRRVVERRVDGVRIQWYGCAPDDTEPSTPCPSPCGCQMFKAGRNDAPRDWQHVPQQDGAPNGGVIEKSVVDADKENVYKCYCVK